MRDFSDSEKDEILEITSKITDAQLKDHLAMLAEREKELYFNHTSRDLELREITLWNISVLSAAADRFNQDQTFQLETKTFDDPQLLLPLQI